MTRHTRTTLLAAGAAATLLLTACGGSGNGSEEIDGIDEGGNEREEQVVTEDPEPTAEEEGVERPEIVFPNGWENVYEGWESDDPTEQAVLNDVREAQNAVDLAILERNPEANYVDFYHDAEALVGAEEWIGGFIRNDRTISGTVRYFDPEVSLQEESGAMITYCADESRGTAIDVNTGEELPDESGQAQVSYSNLLRRDERGVWVTIAVNSAREECG